MRFPFVRPAVVLLAACASWCTALPARAAPVLVFTDRALFQAATTGLTGIYFGAQVTPPDTFTNYPGNSVALSGVAFTADELLFAIRPDFSGGYGLNDGTLLSWQRSDATLPSVLTVALPAGITAVGMDFGAFSSVGFTFSLSSGDAFVLTGSATPTITPTFAGFVSAVPLTGLSITATEFAPQIDRFAFGSGSVAAAVPEPGTLALFVPGLVLLVGAVRRRRSA